MTTQRFEPGDEAMLDSRAHGKLRVKIRRVRPDKVAGWVYTYSWRKGLKVGAGIAPDKLFERVSS